jgi:hypothetical protein
MKTMERKARIKMNEESANAPLTESGNLSENEEKEDEMTVSKAGFATNPMEQKEK